jgi:hypothetical protein
MHWQMIFNKKKKLNFPKTMFVADHLSYKNLWQQKRLEIAVSFT